MAAGLRIASGVWIDPAELHVRFSRSSGPGGQNVNKVATRVTVEFDVAASPALSDEQRGRIRAALPNRIGADGRIRVTCQRFRTQAANRRAAVERLLDLLAEALRPRVPRRATRPTRAAVARRLDAKRQASQRKAERGRRYTPDS